MQPLQALETTARPARQTPTSPREALLPDRTATYSAVLAFLGRAHDAAGRPEQAITVLERVLDGKPDATAVLPVLQHLGHCHAVLGDGLAQLTAQSRFGEERTGGAKEKVNKKLRPGNFTRITEAGKNSLWQT